jgi:glucosamine-6-phosphate deaminase
METKFTSKITLGGIEEGFFNPEDAYERSVVTRFEKVSTNIYISPEEGARVVAQEIADMIRHKAREGKTCVLGLATGSSPIGVYRELIRLHKEEGLSFKNVVTFNLDEYYPMQPNAEQSYNHFMREMLFNHVDINMENVHIPKGALSKDRILNFCKEYEAQIDAYGGIDIQILGIGRTGHIGFNEPGSQLDSETRLIMLDPLTRKDAAKDFNGLENVPQAAITMGVKSIFKARRIILMGWGEGKAPILKDTIEGTISDQVPATFLQNHPNCLFVVDHAAAAELTRVKTPWLVGSCKWNDQMIRKAIVWLCQKLDKPILKLTNKDYNDNGLSELLALHGSAYNVNIDVFNQLQHTITGWPGGKPNADDSNRPERATPAQKRVVVFSPHPDDDVISMGGTLKRLVDQNHEVHVAYQTSGNIAVDDDEALRFITFFKSYQNILDPKNEVLNKAHESNTNFLLNEKEDGQMDTEEVRKIKGLIRRGEAKSACRFVGVKAENLHFLDLPFYETGKVKKNDLSDKDVQLIVERLKAIKPHQIFAAGDLSDPHGTHRVCLDGILIALDQLKDEKWMKECYVWLYRGAWQEWDINQIEMAVPISPEELRHKRNAILRHQSQMENAPFLGNDSRLFWQRSEERNRNTAQQYDKLGMAEYEAIEAFVRYLP